MYKVYVVKDFGSQLYACRYKLEWSENKDFAEHFDTIEGTERFIEHEHEYGTVDTINLKADTTK